ncbi:MAG: BatA domain-containing protein, partial [Planctomycetota bacterium]
MTLLNGILAAGALAFTIPLAIHLLFRSRFRRIDWGAMYLLQDIVRINRRRMQLMNLLLLILRCLIPVLLAISLARPVLTGAKALPGDTPQTWVLVIDDSRSMSTRLPTDSSEAGDESGVGLSTRFDRLKTQLRQLIDQQSRNDSFLLIRTSRAGQPIGPLGRQEAIREIGETEAQAASFDLADVLESAIRAARDATTSQRHILVASDFQSHLLDQTPVEALERLSRLVNDEAFPPSIGWLNLGTNSDQLSNFSIDEIKLDSPAAITGRPTQFVASLRSASDSPVDGLRTTWTVDGIEVASRAVQLPRRSTTQLTFDFTFEEAGYHQVDVRIDTGDALLADNQRSYAVKVVREVDVLLVDGDRRSQALDGETAFLSLALSPFAFANSDRPDAVATRVVTTGQLASTLQKSSPDVVVLANVAKLNSSATSLLVDRIHQGLALLIFDGDRLEPKFYNTPWESKQRKLVLPAALGDVASHPKSAARFGDVNPDFRPWLMFHEAGQPLAESSVSQCREWNLADSATTLLELQSEQPLAVRITQGRGQVIQFALPCDADWSDWTFKQTFVPLIQQLVLSLAGTDTDASVPVGQPITVPIEEFDQLAESIALRKPTPRRRSQDSGVYRYRLLRPDGQESTLQPDFLVTDESLSESTAKMALTIPPTR